MTRHPALAVLLAAALAACSALDNQGRVVADPNIPPAQYRAEITAFLRSYLNDPTGIRDAFVSEPVLTQVDAVRRYAACLRFNAKKSNGQYEGSKDRLVLFLGGRLDTMIAAKPEHCANAAYQAFPEIERLSR